MNLCLDKKESGAVPGKYITRKCLMELLSFLCNNQTHSINYIPIKKSSWRPYRSGWSYGINFLHLFVTCSYANL